MKVQKHQYCPSCGDKLILEDDKYVCVRCLGNYDNRSKLNTTDTIKHLKKFNEFLNYSIFDQRELSDELYKFKKMVKF